MELAPDSAAASAGKGLASVSNWKLLARSERAAWGLCQGSGKEPYQTRVDLVDVAFKCSCPSRKFPCKHGLGLMLLLATQDKHFKQEAEPGWVSEWLESRAEKKDKKEERAKAAVDKPVDVQAQAKRAEQRYSRMLEGIELCQQWLEDLVRRGLAQIRGDRTSVWQDMAGRMVDHQVPGLASSILAIESLLSSGPGWEVRTAEHMGRLHLLLQAGTRLPELPHDVATDVRVALGWPQPKELALKGESVQDTWIAIGQLTEDEERLRSRRTWLLGVNSGRLAMVLEFALASAAAKPAVDADGEIEAVSSGDVFQGEIGFYPSRLPMRGVIKQRGPKQSWPKSIDKGIHESIEAGLMEYAQAIAAKPWTTRQPMAVRGLRVVDFKGAWYLVDREQSAVPIAPGFASRTAMWRLILVASQEHEGIVMMDFDGRVAKPLAIMGQSGHYDLAKAWSA